MRKTISIAATVLLISSTLASAQSITTPDNRFPPNMSMRERTNQQRPRPQRYVCVVPAPRESGRRNYVCPADPGRAGGRCRCPNVTGGGSLQPA
jgi:hypothetical protein